MSKSRLSKLKPDFGKYMLNWLKVKFRSKQIKVESKEDVEPGNTVLVQCLHYYIHDPKWLPTWFKS